MRGCNLSARFISCDFSVLQFYQRRLARLFNRADYGRSAAHRRLLAVCRIRFRSYELEAEANYRRRTAADLPGADNFNQCSGL